MGGYPVESTLEQRAFELLEDISVGLGLDEHPIDWGQHFLADFDFKELSFPEELRGAPFSTKFAYACDRLPQDRRDDVKLVVKQALAICKDSHIDPHVIFCCICLAHHISPEILDQDVGEYILIPPVRVGCTRAQYAAWLGMAVREYRSWNIPPSRVCPWSLVISTIEPCSIFEVTEYLYVYLHEHDFFKVSPPIIDTAIREMKKNREILIGHGQDPDQMISLIESWRK